MADEAAVERELFEVGKRLADALPTTRNPLKVLDEKAMDLASSDAELKAALFRFVDVVPACRSLDDLARHLTSFLDEVEQKPPPLKTATKNITIRARRDEKEKAIGVIESGAEFYVTETMVGWSNILPKHLGVTPPAGGGFYVLSSDVP
jgi:hypothetical protein